MSNIKTPAAACAHFIKTDLKQAFPGIKFSVTSENYSMGDSVNVNWTDGPLYDRVNELVRKYQYGKFDGMTDHYEASNVIDELPQTKYLFLHREIGAEAKAKITADFNKKYGRDYTLGQLFAGDVAPYDDQLGGWPPQLAYRFAQEKQLSY